MGLSVLKHLKKGCHVNGVGWKDHVDKVLEALNWHLACSAELKLSEKPHSISSYALILVALILISRELFGGREGVVVTQYWYLMWSLQSIHPNALYD